MQSAIMSAEAGAREWKFDPHRNFELVGFQKTLG